jgi:hypothetical protein
MGSKIGLILLLAVKTAAADVITSTFGPDDSFITFGGYQVGGGAITFAQRGAVVLLSEPMAQRFE